MRAADTASADPGPLAPITWAVVGDHDQRVVVVDLDADAGERRRVSLAPGEFADHVVQRELASAPRWVWDDTARRYPPLLAAGPHDPHAPHAHAPPEVEEARRVIVPIEDEVLH